MLCRNLTETHNPSIWLSRSGLVATIAITVAVAAAILVCQTYPQLSFSSNIFQNKIVFLAVGGGSSSLALALHVLAFLCADDKPSISLDLPAQPLSPPTQASPLSELPAKKKRVTYIKPPPNPATQMQRSALRREALARLESAKSACHGVDWQQFALMNNTSLIKFSSFDRGLQSYTSLSAHLDYLDLLKQQGCMFSMDESSEIVGALIETLTETRALLSLFPMAIFGVFNGLEFKVKSQQILSKINTLLQRKGCAYLLAGYCGAKKSPGHAAVCKIKQEAIQPSTPLPDLLLYFLNLGEGVQHHPEINVTHTHVKTARCYYPSRIQTEEWQRMAQTFICHLLRFASDAPSEEAGPYSMSEIYDLQSLFAPLCPSLLVSLAQQMEGKSQYLGDCADKAIRNIIIDFLSTEKQLPADQTNKVFLNLHLASLMAAYHAYKRSPNLHHQELLIHGSEEFANILLRSKGLVQEQEYLLVSDMIDVILSEAKNPIGALQPHALLPQNTPPPTHFLPITPPEHMSFSLKTKEIPVVRVYTPPPFQGRQFKQDLENFIQICGTREDLFFQNYLSSLPIPLWEDRHDPWNQIPLEDIKEILVALKTILTSVDQPLSGVNALHVFTLYAIADKLARRANATTRLTGFGSPFAVDQIESFFVFLNPQDEARYRKIKTYFTNNQRASQGKIIFPVSPTLNFSQYRQDKANGKLSSGTHLMDYLDQFSSYVGSFFKRDATLWEKLPVEVHILYYFISIADLKGNSRIQRILSEDPSLKRSLRHEELRLCLLYQDRSSNDVLCTPKVLKDDGRDKISSELMDELILLNQHPKLKIGLAIQWMQAHPQELNHRLVQEHLEYCFFSPGTLKERIESHPETRDELRSFIEKSLSEFRNQREHISSILFFIRLGITCESYFASILAEPINESILLKYEERLRALLVRLKLEHDSEERDYLSAAAHYIYLHREMPISEERFIALYTYLFRYGITTNGSMRYWTQPSLEDMLPSLHNELLIKLRHFLSLQGSREQESLHAICSGILNQLVPGQADIKSRDWQWKSLSTCSSDNYVLEFTNGLIYHRASGAKLTLMFASERDELRIADFNLDPASLWWRSSWQRSTESREYGMAYASFDETITLFQPSCHPPYVVKKNEQHQLPSIALFTREDFKTLYFLNLLPLIHYGVSDAQGNPAVACYHKRSQKPFIRLDFNSQGTTVTRLDEQGHPLPLKLVNLQHLDPRHPLFAHTLLFARYDEILCFIHEKTLEIEELYIPHLKLTFKRGKNGLEANDSGFFFTPMPIKALGSYASRAIVLRHTTGKLKVILPRPPHEELRLGTEKKKQSNPPPVPKMDYSVHHLRTAHDDIPFDSLSAKLFFVYFLKVHGDYERAYQELKKIRNIAFDETTFDVLERFFFCTDHSPFSLAFNLRLILFVVDHFHLFKDEKKEQLEAARRLFARATYWYESYLRAAGDDHYHAIPCEWRLNEVEESRILSTLVREGTKLPRILQVREELLHTEARSAVIKFSPQEVPLSPFSNVLPPSELSHMNTYRFRYGKNPPGEQVDAVIDHPNRVTNAYLTRHFPMLYEQAKKAQQGCTDPFDFTLLALLKLEDIKLPSLLFYVRHFPQCFSDLSFSRRQNDEHDTKTFNTLVDRASQLHLSSEFEDFEMNILKKTASFDYQKTTTLSLPPQLIASGPLPAVDPMDIEPRPFADLCETLFQSFDEGPLKVRTLFDDSVFAEKNAIEQELLKNYEKAYRSLSQEKQTSYRLKRENLDRVKRKLNRRKDQYLTALEASEKKILAYVNDPFSSFHEDFSLAEEREFRLTLNAHQTYQITPEMVMQRAILKNSTLLFDEHRPMLEAKHIQIILEEVHNYYHLKVLGALCTDAIGHIDTLIDNPHTPLIEKELLGILNYTFLYTPEQYPEIAYMKIKTGKLPRPEQVLIYMWVCEGLERHENRHFQLPAGGGKSSYLIPLMILRCKRLQLMACALTTQAMFSTEKENLGHTLSLLEVELDTLDVGMHTTLSLKKLQTIYQNLKKSLQLDNALMLTPQTFYAFRLMYFTSAVDDEEGKKTVLLQKILHFLKQNAVLLADESHRNLDPMTQAVFGIGNFVHLSQQESTLLFELMKPLLGILPTDKNKEADRAKVAKMQEYLRGKLEKEDIQKIKQLLASFLYIDPAVIAFLTDKKTKEPPMLATWREEDRYLALMTRYFLNTLLPKVVKLKTDFDHVFSQEQGEIDTPAYHKTPSHAQFKDPYLTSVLSIKGTWERGLKVGQMRALIERLIAKDREERTLASDAEATPSQKRFQGWIQSKFPALTLRDVDLTNDSQVKELFAHLRKHPEAVEYYLSLVVLSQIGYSSEQFTSTPAHLMDMGKCSVSFSATPLRQIAYPRSLHAAQYDPLFEVRVLAVASQEKNQNFIHPTDVDDFFTHIDQNREALQHVRYMIDADGFVCHEENRDIAQRWLDASHLDGVIYFKEGVADGEESLCLLLRDKRSIEFRGTDHLQSKLAYHDVDWATQAIGIYYDAPHAESANFPAIPHTAAYILAGESMTLSHTIQTIMRERGFLDEAIDQRIIWVVPRALKEKRLEKRTLFHSSLLFSLFLQNEAKAIKSVILMAAFQEIAFKIESIGLSSSTDQSRAIKTYVGGFRDRVKPNQTWESREQLEEMATLLWLYAKGLYARFGYATPFEDQAGLNEGIAQIIAQVQTLITHVVVDFHTRAFTEMHQKCIIQEEMHKVQYQQDRLPIKPEQLQPHKKIIDHDYPQSLNPQNEVRAIFKTPHLTQNFYLERNQLHTARVLKSSLKEKFIKPINFLMIIIHKDKVYAEAISHDVLVHHIEDLKNPPKDPDIQHQAFIIRADGVLYQEGSGSLAPSKEQRDQVLRSVWLQDILIDVALLKGRILNNNRFIERVKKWPQFLEFWSQVLQALPHPKEHSLNALLSYLPAEMKEMPDHLLILKPQGEKKCLV